MQFDLAVIGSGPAGLKAAVQSAQMGRRVAVIEGAACVGGVCVNTGTIPSKSLREAILHLTGRRQRRFYGANSAIKQDITMDDLNQRTQQVIRGEIDVIRTQMARCGVRLVQGEAAFVDPHRLRINRPNGEEEVEAEHILIATGSKPHRPSTVPFTPGRIIDSDQILQMTHLPASLIVVGGGVIGVEYACMFAAVGVSVTLLDKRPRLLEFADSEIADALQFHMRDMDIRLCMCEEIAEIQLEETAVHLSLKSGKRLTSQTVLYAAGRTGNTDRLQLDKAGLAADDRGRIKVNDYFQTDVPHIYAAGDVIGFPSLAATSMEQGRLAASYMFGQMWEQATTLFPIGIYTVPEISMCGKTEAELTNAGIPFDIGVARYREIARGQLMGDEVGMLKLLFHPESRRLLGTHIIGEGATELVHIGQTAMAADLPIDYFVTAVFNYPTLAECYRVAALDGIRRMSTSLRRETTEAPATA